MLFLLENYEKKKIPIGSSFDSALIRKQRKIFQGYLAPERVGIKSFLFYKYILLSESFL